MLNSRYMDSERLQKFGLNESQAAAYLTLVQYGKLTPPRLAELTGETRTNAYMLLDQLETMGLAAKDEKYGKRMYRPQHPAALEELVKGQRQEALERENELNSAMPELLSYFYTYSEQPGVRFFQGTEGLKEIYEDTLSTGEDIYFLRAQVEIETLGSEFFERYKQRRAEHGITTYAFTQYSEEGKKNAPMDEQNKMVRTWLHPEEYTAPVEMNTYGDKVAFISFGEELMGVIVESPQIAEGMRQVFQLMQKGAKLRRAQDQIRAD